jgi:hypothetical protein
MVRAILALLAALLIACVAHAFEAIGTIRSVDTAKKTMEVFAGGQVRVVRVSPDARFLDREGKPLAGGLASAELKSGVEVTLTVEPEGGQPVIRIVRLGAVQPGARPPIPKPDTSALKPLPELGSGKYQGYEGGLYPGGKNERPSTHEAAGLALARSVRPLDPAGKPSADGKIVLLTIGMSNASQASQAFIRQANADPQKNPQLVVVNGAQGAMTAARIQNPDDNGSGTQYWRVVDERLQQAGVTRAQVQAVWIKEADAGPTQGFPAYAKTLQQELGRIVRILPQRFPNVKLAYLSPRTYGGYATTPLNPDPYAYESGFSVKWLVEQQIQGDADVSFDPKKGVVKAPWLSWGAYLWANGMRKNADGLFYEQSDFGPDGTHPSPAGQTKVGEVMLRFFKSDATTKPWFVR